MTLAQTLLSRISEAQATVDTSANYNTIIGCFDKAGFPVTGTTDQYAYLGNVGGKELKLTRLPISNGEYKLYIGNQESTVTPANASELANSLK